MIANRGGIMRSDSVWTFDLAPGVAPPEAAPDVLLTYDPVALTATYQPRDPETWVERSVYVRIEGPPVEQDPTP